MDMGAIQAGREARASMIEQNGERSVIGRDERSVSDTCEVSAPKRQLAFIVSHPIQYYAPLYQRLALRKDLHIKVFFTWHGGEDAVFDVGFQSNIQWDLPLTEGYEFEVVPNTSGDPGTHRFLGLRNPSLVSRVFAWKPDAVHVTGWAWASHLMAMRALRKAGTPVLFRGDSHLLDTERRGDKWWVKQHVLKRVFSWPAALLCVGKANRRYYEAFGVEASRIFDCPHSIDVSRFQRDDHVFEQKAAQWRADLGLIGRRTFLFAGKFEPRKRPLELMSAFRSLGESAGVLIMVGGGELTNDVMELANEAPERFRILPFQNQSLMPVIYRLGDVFVLPSAWGETWGLAVNEALACGRPVIVSDRVGCAADLVDDRCGRVFSWHDPPSLSRALADLGGRGEGLADLADQTRARAASFDIQVTEAALMRALDATALRREV